MKKIHSEIKRILQLLCLLSLLSSCKKDFLYTPPTDKGITDEFISDLATCEQVLNGSYIKLSVPFYNGQNVTIYADLTADNIKPVSTGRALTSAYSWNQNANELWNAQNVINMNSMWLSGYDLIRQSNLVIENVEKFRSEDPLKADDIKAQAISLRAFVHFQLLNVFAQPYAFTNNGSHPGIPFVEGSNITVPITKRSTVGENYSRIISDLKMALGLIDPSKADKTRISGLAIKALLARVELYKGDYAQAIGFARQVSSAVPIMLINYPSKLFTNQETEAILQLLPMQFNINGSTSTSFAGSLFVSTNPTFIATSDIANLLSENSSDRRKSWINSVNNRLLISKYPTGVIPGFSVPSKSYYQTLIRSSEMYLTAAECYARTGKTDSALYFVNAIRTRANPGISPLTSSGQPLLDDILKERRKELCFEGLRMFDLLRNKMGVKRTDVLAPAGTALPYPSPKAIAPLPSVDILISHLTQNESY